MISMNNLEHKAIMVVAKFTPWIAPLPSAAFIYRAAILHLHTEVWIAATIAVVVEALGLTTIYTALWMYTWNQSKRKSDPQAPAHLAYYLISIYLSTTMTLILVLEVWPNASRYAPALFPFLAVVGGVNLALIVQQGIREDAITAQKQERKAARKTPQIAVSTMPQKSTQMPQNGTANGDMRAANKSKQQKIAARDDEFLRLWNNGVRKTGELAEALNVGPDTVRRTKAKFNGALSNSGG